MDFSELKDKAEDIFSDLKEKISDFVSENKIMSIAISALVVVILICIILLSVTSKKKKDKTPEIPKMTLELSAEQKIPDGPELPRNYNLYREPSETWTEEESRQWFTNPTEKEVNALSSANDSLINEIIEAAP